MVPVLPMLDMLGAATKLTVPEPIPRLRPLMVSQGAAGSGTAVQEQPAFRTPILMGPPPPPEGTVAFRGVTPKRQPEVSWLTVNDLPAIARVVLREAPPFACTEKDTVPTPIPVAPAVILTQETGLEAVHWGQPFGEFTTTE